MKPFPEAVQHATLLECPFQQLQCEIMNYWWVNQNGTYKHEVPGNYMWSPKTKTNGHRNQFYLNMKEVRPGDVVFSFCDTKIKAIGIVTGKAAASPKPAFGKSGAAWSNSGWLVDTAFTELKNQIRPKDHATLLAPLLPKRYSPLSAKGDGYQSVYLAEVPDPLAMVLIGLIGEEFEIITSGKIDPEEEDRDKLDDDEEDAIRGKSQSGATSAKQLIEARRGQGVFRANVWANEKSCRVTGVSDPKHLRASHIKPWCKSDDSEKIHGANGLMLAPHVDHLFDRGYISFEDDGTMKLSPDLSNLILSTWAIPFPKNVGVFKPAQRSFLAYHRRYVFKK